MAIVKRGSKIRKSGNGKGFRHDVGQHGPFAVYFGASNEKDASGAWQPNGDLKMVLEVGQSWPRCQLVFNVEGAGPLATVAEHLPEFQAAVASAVKAWSDDKQYTAAKAAVEAYAGQPAGTVSPADAVLNVVRKRA